MAGLAGGCGLDLTGLVEPVLYDPASYLKEPKLLRRLDRLSWLGRAAWAEQMSGILTKHIAYLVRPEDAAGAVACPDGADVVPVLRDVDGSALAKRLRPGGVLDVDLPGLTLALPLPRLAGPMLARFDGRTSLGAIFEQVAALDRGLDWPAFKGQFDQLYRALNGIGKVYLRRPTPRCPA